MDSRSKLQLMVDSERRSGLRIGGGSNGGGYVRFARAIGFDGKPTRADAKAFLEKEFERRFKQQS